MRKRRYSLLTRDDRSMRLPYTLQHFGDFCFRPLLSDAHVYLQDDDIDVHTRIARMARRRFLPDEKPDGTRWSMREVLPEGMHQRLLSYERSCRKKSKEFKYIINLRQNSKYMGPIMGELMPTVMRTSMLWDMQEGRLFSARELLCAHGVRASSHKVEKGTLEHMVELMLDAGKLSFACRSYRQLDACCSCRKCVGVLARTCRIESCRVLAAATGAANSRPVCDRQNIQERSHGTSAS